VVARSMNSVLTSSEDQLARDRVRQRDVGADVETEPRSAHCADAVRRGSTTIELRAVLDPLEHVVEEDRMRLARV
jgi:hypothetical protein